MNGPMKSVKNTGHRLCQTLTSGSNYTHRNKDETQRRTGHGNFNMAGKRDSLSGLNNLTMTQLMRIPGIGRVKAIQIQCVLELSKRIQRSCTSMGRTVQILM